MYLRFTLPAMLTLGVFAGLTGCQHADLRAESVQTATPQALAGAQAEPATQADGYFNPAVDAERRAGLASNPHPLRILSIGAHPADVFDQSGGTMAHHVARGDWVGCVVMTQGTRVHDKVVSNEMFQRKEIPSAEEMKTIMAERADVKAKEIIRACGILGVKEQDVYFMGADDAVLLVTDPLVRATARLIRKLKPDVILTHYPLEEMGVASAHATCGQIVMLAINLAGGVDPGDSNPPHKVTQVFCFGIGAAATRTDRWGGYGGFYNDIFVDITDVVGKKLACLDAVASQGYAGAYARKRIESSDGAFGNRMRFAYAEGFISIHSTGHYYLPVSEIDRDRAANADHENMRRATYKLKLP